MKVTSHESTLQSENIWTVFPILLESFTPVRVFALFRYIDLFLFPGHRTCSFDDIKELRLINRPLLLSLRSHQALLYFQTDFLFVCFVNLTLFEISQVASESRIGWRQNTFVLSKRILIILISFGFFFRPSK